jgi:hypothetical protein
MYGGVDDIENLNNTTMGFIMYTNEDQAVHFLCI